MSGIVGVNCGGDGGRVVAAEEQLGELKRGRLIGQEGCHHREAVIACAANVGSSPAINFATKSS